MKKPRMGVRISLEASKRGRREIYAEQKPRVIWNMYAWAVNGERTEKFEGALITKISFLR